MVVGRGRDRHAARDGHAAKRRERSVTPVLDNVITESKQQTRGRKKKAREGPRSPTPVITPPRSFADWKRRKIALSGHVCIQPVCIQLISIQPSAEYSQFSSGKSSAQLVATTFPYSPSSSPASHMGPSDDSLAATATLNDSKSFISEVSADLNTSMLSWPDSIDRRRMTSGFSGWGTLYAAKVTRESCRSFLYVQVTRNISSDVLVVMNIKW